MSRTEARTHSGGKPNRSEIKVSWVKIKAFDRRGLTRAHEEFTHVSWDGTLDRITHYLKKLSSNGEARSFEISITPSEE